MSQFDDDSADPQSAGPRGQLVGSARIGISTAVVVRSGSASRVYRSESQRLGTWTSSVIVPLMVAVLAATIALASPATAEPSPLCRADRSRGSIPADFPLQACIDSSNVWIRNTQNVPVAVTPNGSIGMPWLFDQDLGLGAELTRTAYPDPQILLPGELLRVPIGSAPASISVAEPRSGEFYALATFLAEHVFGYLAQNMYVLVTLVRELVSAFRNLQDCVSRKGTLGKAVCLALFARDVPFAFGRAASALNESPVKPFVSSDAIRRFDSVRVDVDRVFSTASPIVVAGVRAWR